MPDLNLFPELSHQLVGIAMNVHNSYGFSHKDAIYQRALEEEFLTNKIKFTSQPKIPVHSKNSGKILGWYQPDLLIEDSIIIEIKATPYTNQNQIKQILDYLAVSNIELGYLLNFGLDRLDFKRLIFTNNRKSL